MRNLIPVKSIGVFILLLNTCFSGQAQLEIDGGSPGIKVTSGNIAGQFNGVELGVKATNSIVGKAVEGIDESTSASSAGVKGFSTLGKGVFGESSQGIGVYGESQDYRGVWGYSNNSYGIYGSSNSGAGGYFSSDSIAAQLKGHLKLESLTNNHNWQMEINSLDGYLLLFYNGVFKGSFNPVNGNYAGVSDRKFKENIVPVQSRALDYIEKLRPVTYRMLGQDTRQRTFGLIAQEVQEILPDMVEEITVNDDQLYSIAYTELIPLLIKGMQEQQEEIRDLLNRVESQEKIIQSLIGKSIVTENED